MSSSLDKIARLTIDIQPRVLGTMGMRQLDSFYAAAVRGGQKQVLAAKAVADARMRESERATRALLAANDQVDRSNKALALATIRRDDAAASGRIASYRRWALEVQSLNDKVELSNRKLSDSQIAAARRLAAAQNAQSRAAATGRMSTAGAIAGTAGSAFLGAGFAGVAVGGYTLDQAIKWQQFTAQNRANAPMSTAELNRYRSLALRIGAQDGANPNDIFLALRYGAEASLSGPALRRYLNASIALGLPTGGSAAIGGAQQALITVGKNFPGYAQNPNAIANMLMSTVQHSARGINVSDLVGALPKLLVMAGHIGGPQALPDSLAMYAAMSQAGIPADVIATQGENFLKVLMTGATRKGTLTYKTLSALQKQDGINLFPDFSQKGLQQKGIAGVVSDIKNANLSQSALLSLFPNMKGMLAAMGLTGNQYMTYQRAVGDITKAPQQNPIAKNMQQYLGLDATKLKKIEEQLHVLAITTGTQLLPVFNDLLKNDIVPGVKDFDAFVKSNQGLIKSFIDLTPRLLVIGAGLKIVAGGLSMAAKIDELKLAFTKFGNVLTFLGAGPGGGEMGLITAGMGNMKRAAGEALAPTGDLAVATSTLGKDAAISDVLNATASGEEAVGAKAALATPEVAAFGGALAKTDATLVGAAAGGVGGGLLGSLTKLTAILARLNPFLLAASGSLAVGHVLKTTPLVTRKIDGQVFGLKMQNGQWYPAKSGPGGSELIVDNGHKYRPVGPTYNPTGMQVQVNGQWVDISRVPPSQGGTGPGAGRGSGGGTYLPTNTDWAHVRPSSSVFGMPTSGAGTGFSTGPTYGPKVGNLPGIVGHWDLLEPKGTAFYLPPGGQWSISVVDYNSAWGWEVRVLTPGGGLIQLLHFSKIAPGIKAGASINSKSRVLVGWAGFVGSDSTASQVHVAMNQAAEQYIFNLTRGKNWRTYTPASGQNYIVKEGSGTAVVASRVGGATSAASLALPASQTAYAGAFASAGSTNHIDPSLFSGLSDVEGYGNPGWGKANRQGYGSMGVAATAAAAANSGSPNYGTGAASQIGGAGQQLRKWINWVITHPSFFMAHKKAADYVLSLVHWNKWHDAGATKNAETLVIALACYNTGPGGDVDGAGMNYAYRVIADSMRANHGGFPATYYTGQGPNRIPTNPGGSSGTNSVNLSTGSATKPSVGDVQGTLDTLTAKYRNPDGTINFSKMPSWLRTQVDGLIRALGTAHVAEMGNQLNNAVSTGLLTRPAANRDYQLGLYQTYNQYQTHPEEAYNQAIAGKGTKRGAAYWSAKWAGKATHDKAQLARLLAPYIDPTTGKVDWSKVPTDVRKAADFWIRQIAKDQYMSERGDLNANVSDPKVRATLMSAYWSGKGGYTSAYKNPEAWWDAITGGKSGKYTGATAGSSAWHIIGKNCEAATHALQPAKQTAHNTHQIHIVSASILTAAQNIHAELVKLNKAIGARGAGHHSSNPKKIGVRHPSVPGRY